MMGMEDSKNHVSDIKAVKQAPAPSPHKIHKFKGLDEVIVGDSLSAESQDWDGVEENSKPATKRDGVLRLDISDRNHKQPRLSHAPSKKVIKALRQQAKRRRKNTTIASGNTAALNRMPVSTPCELDEVNVETAFYRQPTMAEVLASIPGFSIKPRKRSNKKLSAAAQLEQTKEGCVDLETPDSILVNSNLRSLLNKHTFSSLPPLYQYKLLQLLPHVDRTPVQSESMFRLSPSGLNNEFFARACLDWRERLAEGEFTPENQAKIKAEQEKEKSKLDPWKLKHFEPMWGESLQEWPSLPPVNAAGSSPLQSPLPSISTTLPLKSKERAPVKVTKPTPPPPPLRTVGAVTRAVTSYREKRQAETAPTNTNKRTKSTEPKESALMSVNSKVEPVINIPVINDKSDELLTPVESVSTAQPSLLTLEEETDKEAPPIETPFYTDTTDVSDPEVKQDITPSETQVQSQSPTKSDDDNPPREKAINDIYTSPMCTISEFVETSCGVESSDETQESIQHPCEGLKTEKEILDHIITTIHMPIENDESSDAKSSLNDESTDPTSSLQLTDSNSEHQVSIDETVLTVNHVNTQKYEGNTFESLSGLGLCKENSSETIISLGKGDAVSLGSPILSLTTTDLDKPSFKSPAVDEVSLLPDSGSISYESPLNYEDESKNSPTPNDTLVPDNPIGDVEEALTSERTQLKFNSDNNLSFGVGSEVDESVASVVLSQTIEGRLQSLPEIRDPFGPASGMDAPNVGGDSLHVEKLDNNSETLALRVSSEEVSAVTSLSGLSQIEDVRKSLERVEEDWEIIKVDPNEMNDKEQTTYDYQDILYTDPLKGEAAILAAAWDVVGSSTEFKDIQQPVSIIPCKEELEVRLQESSLPAPHWQQFQETQQKGMSGHVKLELEVTLTPEVDNQVSSSVEQGGAEMNKSDSRNPSVKEVGASSVTVIPPTTIVCLPPPPVASQAPPPAPTSAHASSSALPYLALTTSTPVRALPTKTVSKGGSGRSGRNTSNKPPPGAVNLERSYQICQAVIQNSPNRDQLRCQLRPPPSLLAKGLRQVTTARTVRPPRPAPPQHVLLKQVFTSAQGIPVNMAVLPSGHHTSNQQVGEFLMIGQRATARRSNSAPPSNMEVNPAGQLRGRPASVGLHQTSDPPSTVPFQDCACSLKAMIACRKCGAFCHNDCIRPSRLCLTCDSR